jgi:hypothetical protein
VTRPNARRPRGGRLSESHAAFFKRFDLRPSARPRGSNRTHAHELHATKRCPEFSTRPRLSAPSPLKIHPQRSRQCSRAFLIHALFSKGSGGLGYGQPGRDLLDALVAPASRIDAGGIHSDLWNTLVSVAFSSKGVFLNVQFIVTPTTPRRGPLSPMPALAQGGGGGVGSAGGASAGSSSGGGTSGAAAGAPNAGSAGAGTTTTSGVTGPANVGGLNNSGNDPSGAGNAARAANTPGTNSAGTANSSGSTSAAGGAPMGSTTVGTAGNPAGGAVGGRIDGTVTSGPAMPGDDAIRAESSQDSVVDKKVKSICKGC